MEERTWLITTEDGPQEMTKAELHEYYRAKAEKRVARYKEMSKPEQKKPSPEAMELWRKMMFD